MLQTCTMCSSVLAELRFSVYLCRKKHHTNYKKYEKTCFIPFVFLYFSDDTYRCTDSVAVW